MANKYYSYCCAKLVEKNSSRKDLVEKGLIPEKGHHCSRCKKPLTVYGNPIREEDKQKFLDSLAYRKVMISFTTKEDVDNKANGDFRLYFQ